MHPLQPKLAVMKAEGLEQVKLSTENLGSGAKQGTLLP